MSLSKHIKNSRSLIIALGMFMLFSTSSGKCQAANQATLNAEKMITEAKAIAPLISVSELSELIASEIPFGLIDVRSEGEFEAGHIKDSELITRSILEFVIQNGGLGEDDRKIIIYCRSGNRSALAIKTMLDLGFTDVRHLDGGFNAWSEANQPYYNAQGLVKIAGSDQEK